MDVSANDSHSGCRSLLTCKPCVPLPYSTAPISRLPWVDSQLMVLVLREYVGILVVIFVSILLPVGYQHASPLLSPSNSASGTLEY
jgi:hypothetical protein